MTSPGVLMDFSVSSFFPSKCQLNAESHDMQIDVKFHTIRKGCKMPSYMDHESVLGPRKDNIYNDRK